MPDNNKFLWLEGIFNEATVRRFKSISPASNFWQTGFVQALCKLDNQVNILGFPYERVWPFGKFLVRNRQAELQNNFVGEVVGYINLPFIKVELQYQNLKKRAKKILTIDKEWPDYLIVFSCLEKSTDETPAIRLAKKIRESLGIPWICIIADGAVPPGADGYVILPWSVYNNSNFSVPTLHLDGGISDELYTTYNQALSNKAPTQNKVLMYMGSLMEHSGALQLAQAFQKINDSEAKLCICGRGNNKELTQIAQQDKRILLKGFVEENQLNKLAHEAYAFINPRPLSFQPNQFNYPSKLLHYLSYGKPVISTLTAGVSPEYSNIIINVPDESGESLRRGIERLLTMESIEYSQMVEKINIFNQTHTWSYQINRFISWLNTNFH
ncbi:glycosyltransferase family 4 protein [Legionella impletisoli]|uniref:Uncharacterized protein n=1 Tax=Legionella impletisoli TaxID=343510 RepID=A0A917JRL9_9GAMM|nr:glycosyltransferase family 4 protein [Legionella impletisoli]GGI82038.1 hypothetical protein GCM10007966_08280 [Legionella impletisoli]